MPQKNSLKTMKKEYRVQIRTSQATLDSLERLSEHLGLTKSAVARVAVAFFEKEFLGRPIPSELLEEK